jgi:hypothetical protein
MPHIWEALMLTIFCCYYLLSPVAETTLAHEDIHSFQRDVRNQMQSLHSSMSEVRAEVKANQSINEENLAKESVITKDQLRDVISQQKQLESKIDLLLEALSKTKETAKAESTPGISSSSSNQPSSVECSSTEIDHDTSPPITSPSPTEFRGRPIHLEPIITDLPSRNDPNAPRRSPPGTVAKRIDSIRNLLYHNQPVSQDEATTQLNPLAQDLEPLLPQSQLPPLQKDGEEPPPPSEEEQAPSI